MHCPDPRTLASARCARLAMIALLAAAVGHAPLRATHTTVLDRHISEMMPVYLNPEVRAAVPPLSPRPGMGLHADASV